MGAESRTLSQTAMKPSRCSVDSKNPNAPTILPVPPLKMDEPEIAMETTTSHENVLMIARLEAVEARRICLALQREAQAMRVEQEAACRQAEIAQRAKDTTEVNLEAARQKMNYMKNALAEINAVLSGNQNHALQPQEVYFSPLSPPSGIMGRSLRKVPSRSVPPEVNRSKLATSEVRRTPPAHIPQRVVQATPSRWIPLAGAQNQPVVQTAVPLPLAAGSHLSLRNPVQAPGLNFNPVQLSQR